jgi:hypothetical protein
MSVRRIAKFLIGDADSIRRLASSSASFPTGLILVFLTAFARNYDQTFILEKPLLWFLGPVAFSLISGTWVFLITYAIAWGYIGPERPRFWSAWISFMGVFWMTAPIAWLYAIPAERLFDGITAAQMNVGLLAIVAAWRVVLMARIMQVLTGPPFMMALAWVLLAATVEVLLLYVFGGGLSKRIMAGMMGMRNSPEEEVLLRAFGVAATLAFWTLIGALVTTIFWRMKSPATALPTCVRERVSWPALIVMTVFWIAATIVPQREVSRNAAVDAMIARAEFRRVVDYLSAHRREDFAPSRMLPPKPFERELFRQLSGLFEAVRASDAIWVQDHLLLRLNQLCSHFRPPWSRSAPDTGTREERIREIESGLKWAQGFSRFNAQGFRSILDGLERIPAGSRWLTTNEIFLTALANIAAEPLVQNHRGIPDDLERAEWRALAVQLAGLRITNTVDSVAPVAKKPL